ncbi:pentapeptide repeat-containing protein [Cyanobium sp. Maggiore-St4-Cus]|nr:pentapeptide repeat-containing protein [Cyanobium sp. Maggiore-St4-Cus]
MALLLVVNSYATCRNNRWAPGCLWRDAEALISVGNVESLSIVTAAFLYVLEAQKRRQRDNIEAYELLMNCNASGVKWLVGRISALEILNSAGLPIDGQELAGFDLRNLQAANGHWHNVNLEGSVLRRANLAGTDLSGSNLRGADLRDADLRGAILVGADLEGALLDGALLEGAQLDGAELDGAQLDRASLDSGAPNPS